MPLLVQIVRQVGLVGLQQVALTLDNFGECGRQFRCRIQQLDGFVSLAELLLNGVEVDLALLGFDLLAEELVTDVHFFIGRILLIAALRSLVLVTLFFLALLIILLGTSSLLSYSLLHPPLHLVSLNFLQHFSLLKLILIVTSVRLVIALLITAIEVLLVSEAPCLLSLRHDRVLFLLCKLRRQVQAFVIVA